MKFVHLVLLTSLLAGCATTPQETITTGHRVMQERRSAPKDIASCFERNARNAPGSPVTYRDEKFGGRVDVTIRADFDGSVVVAEISPLDSGSRIYVYIAKFFTDDPEGMANALLRGC